MNLLTIILLAISLSADAFAVAISAGISTKKVLLKQALLMALYFGIFQAIMPIIGFSFTSLFVGLLQKYINGISFLLLAYIGGNMFYEGYKNQENSSEKDIFTQKSLFLLGLATSIDALVVGVSLTATEKSIIIPAILIGVITSIVSFLGVEFGKRFGEKIGSHAEIIGGLILIGIGIKILI